MTNTNTQMTMPERVASGAAYLDRHQPGWADKIDPAILNIASCKDCILGQLYGDYVIAIYEDGLDSPVQRAAHGFAPMPSDELTENITTARLSSLWEYEVRRR